MLNKVILIGNTGKEPEIINIENGSIAKISLATSESYKNKQGEKVTNTEWHNLVIYGKLAEIVSKYVKKGDMLYIEGKIEYKSYEKEGKKLYSTQIKVNELKMMGNSKKHQESIPQSSNIDVSNEDTDDLPF